jgi:fatty-acyl-CoA synthase
MKGLTPYEENVIRRVAVGDLLIRTTARYPHMKALRFRERSYTYEELNAAVNRCAHGLTQMGIKKGDRCAILSHNCDQFIILWWGLMKIGAIITPLNFMLKNEEVTYIINHSQPVAFFVEDKLIPNVLPIKDKLKTVRTFGYINLAGDTIPEGWMNIEELWKAEYPITEPEALIYPDDPALLLYTSGTESAPKGVINTHLNFFSICLSAVVDLHFVKGDVIIGGIPLYHVAAMYLCIACVALGATNLMEYAPDPVEILKFTQEDKVTIWVWPPTLYINLPLFPNFDQLDFSSLKLCIVFGALCPPAVLDRWRTKLPSTQFMNYYGQTEMSPLGACLQDDDFATHSDSIGRSHVPLELKVFGPDDKELPRGEVGELVARGPAIMLGYYKEKAKTASTFRGGWHHTGDIVRMNDEGFIYFVDRAKDIIRTGGENVSSQEVEAFLYKHPKVADAAVIGMPDPVWSEAVTAIIVPMPGQTLTEKDIIDFCKQSLAAYKVPKNIFFVEALPRNPSGKIMKNVLRKECEDKLTAKA